MTGRGLASCQVDTLGSQSDCSEKDSNLQDSSNDADSEASESEWSPRIPSVSTHSNTADKISTTTTLDSTAHNPSLKPNLSPSPTSVASIRPQQGGAVEQLVSAVSKLGLVHTSNDTLPVSHSPEEPSEIRERDRQQHHQGAFQALCHSYTPSSKECSVQSCLHQFTSVELLMGNNKLLCENCTERRQRQVKRSGMYTDTYEIYIYSCICWPLHSKEESLKDIIPLMNIQKFGVGLNIFAIKKLHTYFRLTKATLHLF